VFFYEILILNKSKNINVFCFQIIANQTNHDYIFQLFFLIMIIYFNETNNITKIYNRNSFYFLMTQTTIFIIEKVVV